MDKLNDYNVEADRLVYGKWSKLNQDYFANPKVAENMWQIFRSAKVKLSKDLELIEFGSADGFLGEYFKNKLNKNHSVVLTITDIVEEHLKANKHKETTKIRVNMLNFSIIEKYDLALVRSLLHYFSEESQKLVLHNVYQSIKKGGYALFQLFIQNEGDYELFMKLNKYVGKNLQLLPRETTFNLIKNSGYREVIMLEDALTWDCSSDNLRFRYRLTDQQVAEMRDIIRNTKEKYKEGFNLLPNAFTVPIPYKVVLAKK